MYQASISPMPLHLIRGLKAPCSWNYLNKLPNPPNLSPDQIKIINQDNLINSKVSLRRDGLLTIQNNDSVIEWIIPSDIAISLENNTLLSHNLADFGYENLQGLEINFYGVPQYSEKMLFSTPTSIQWDLTSRCNLLCKHCYASATSKGGEEELSKTKVFEIIDEAAQLGVKALHLLGGEPFIRKDLSEIIQFACNLGVGCHISSNGTLITKQHAQMLEGLNNLTIDISLDSVLPENHDWLRGKKGAFKRALEGIKSLLERGIVVGSTCTIYPTTLEEMESVVNQAYDLGLYRLQFLFVSPVGRAKNHKEDLLINELEQTRFANTFNNLVEKYKGKLLIDSPVVPYEPKNFNEEIWYKNDLWLTGCLAGIDKMAIASDGTVKACPQLKQIYGDVKSSTIKEIWDYMHSDRLTKLGMGCTSSNFSGFCGGGCPAPNEYEDEIAPCLGRKTFKINFQKLRIAETAAYCPTDRYTPCNCPIFNPCDCPTWCNQPCNFPCDCPTWCASPCSCPTWCASPCSCPTWCASPCSCPTWCALPCSCPTYCSLPCPVPCSCPTFCSFPCSCPTHCPFPR